MTLVPDIQVRPEPPADPAATPGPAPGPGGRIDLVGLSKAELIQALAATVGAGQPDKWLRMRANQLWHWLYFRGATDFDQMTSISKEMRSRLESSTCFSSSSGPWRSRTNRGTTCVSSGDSSSSHRRK